MMIGNLTKSISVLLLLAMVQVSPSAAVDRDSVGRRYLVMCSANIDNLNLVAGFSLYYGLSKVDVGRREFPRSYLGTGMGISIRTIGDSVETSRIGLRKVLSIEYRRVLNTPLLTPKHLLEGIFVAGHCAYWLKDQARLIGSNVLMMGCALGINKAITKRLRFEIAHYIGTSITFNDPAYYRIQLNPLGYVSLSFQYVL